MTASMLPLVAPAMLAGVVFSGAHAFAGIRLADRGLLFVALPIAQAAALGAAISILTGGDPLSIGTAVWSIVFGVAAAALLSRLRAHRETLAAIVFVISAAAALIVLGRTPQAMEHATAMFAGNLPAVSLHALLRIAIIDAAAAILLAIRKTSDALLCIATALIAATAVPVAGVLLDFSYLVIPPVAATLFSRSTGKRLTIAWTTGALVTAIGIVLSFRLDLSTGAAIVCTFGIALLLMASIRAFTRRRNSV